MLEMFHISTNTVLTLMEIATLPWNNVSGHKDCSKVATPDKACSPAFLSWRSTEFYGKLIEKISLTDSTSAIRIFNCRDLHDDMNRAITGR